MAYKDSFTLHALQIICENVTDPVLKEYVNFQPNMFDKKNATPKSGTIDVNGEKVNVRPSKNNDCYVYEFGPKLSDYLYGMTDDERIEELAGFMYDVDNNEFGKILDLADKDDILMFNSSNGNFAINVGDVYRYLNYLKYQDAHNKLAAESIKEADEDSDWLVIWQNSRAKKDDEPYLSFLNRLKDSY